MILGGTELPLTLRDAMVLGIPLLDTTKIHVRAMVMELGPRQPDTAQPIAQSVSADSHINIRTPKNGTVVTIDAGRHLDTSGPWP
jgi:hypothetical protein